MAGWLARLGASLRGTLDYAELGHASDGAVHLSRALPVFFEHMRNRSAPEIVDLGPVVGENVSLLGGRLGCKVHIDTVLDGAGRPSGDQQSTEVRAAVPVRLDHPDNSIDGVLCWDVIDYLSPAAAAALVAELVRVLKPGGIGMALFSTFEADVQRYRKYVMVDEHHLCHRNYPGTQLPCHVRSGRDVQVLLSALDVDESFLLKHRQRETLFHKPGPANGRGCSPKSLSK